MFCSVSFYMDGEVREAFEFRCDVDDDGDCWSWELFFGGGG